MRKPDFFIVGAPKSGTTSLAFYLRQHTEIYLPQREMHFFSKDFRIEREILTLDHYLACFSDAPQGVKRIGEKSVSYLYSEIAPLAIKEFNPQAKIIVMLRNPIDFMVSLHAHLLREGVEVIDNFEDALAAEEHRKKGQRLPSGTPALDFLFYRERAQYCKYVERYLHIFGEGHTKIIIFEEFISDTIKALQEVLKFLEVDANAVPGNLEPKNPYRGVKSVRLHNAITRVLVRAPIAFLGSRRRKIPENMRKWYRWLRARIISWNLTADSPRPAIHAQLERMLREEITPEVEKLGRLLGRDLRALWLDSQRQV
jgi:hypothetical protein